jgi:holo-[acyl-carrier protein] synthase
MKSLSVPLPTIRIGTDIVRISRINESVDEFGDRFLARVYTPGEIEYARSAPLRTNERLAGRLAAKEAALKALGLVNRGIPLTELEVQHLDDGSCEMVLHGSARRVVDATAGASMSVSVSHEDDYATAVVVFLTVPSSVS